MKYISVLIIMMFVPWVSWAAAPAPSAGYDGKFFLQSGDGQHRLQPQLRLQSRFVASFEEPESGNETKLRFLMPRVQINMTGHLYGKGQRFRLMVDFGKGATQVKHAYADLELVGTHLFVRIGHDKRPYSRQQMASVGGLQLIGRALTDQGFHTGHDIGLYFHNAFHRSPTWEWSLGIFNGPSDKRRLTGRTILDAATGEAEIIQGKTTNLTDDMRPALVGRFGYNYGQVRGYREGDLDGGPLRLGMAIGALHELDEDDDGRRFSTANWDYILKVNHFATSGGLFWSETRTDAGTVGRWGLHLQAGYAALARYEPVIRTSAVSDDDGTNVMELTIGLNIYAHGNSIKWMTSGSRYVHRGGARDFDHHLVQGQLQLQF